MSKHIRQSEKRLLIEFLPIFSAPDFSPTIPNKNSCYPMYRQEVTEFFGLCSSLQYENCYRPTFCQKLIEQPSLIERVSIEEIGELMLYCARTERFCDGAWNQLFEDRVILCILNRLAEL